VSTQARGSTTGRPLMRLLDLLGRRWTLRVLWELRDGALTFTALRHAAASVSQSVLTLRMRQLTEAGLVQPSDVGYQLTPAGRELVQEMARLDRWAERWAADASASDLSQDGRHA